MKCINVDSLQIDLTVALLFIEMLSWLSSKMFLSYPDKHLNNGPYNTFFSVDPKKAKSVQKFSSFKVQMKVLSNKIAEHFNGGESNRIS